MAGFLLGLVIGNFSGIFIISLMYAAREGDIKIDRSRKNDYEL